MWKNKLKSPDSFGQFSKMPGPISFKQSW